MIMNIVCATDDNYVQHCGVMLTSLFENNREEKIHIYLLTEKLSEHNIQAIENIIKTYKNIFHYCTINSNTIKDCPLNIRSDDHLPLATYYRLLIPNILPIKESKAIYLDCDIIINSSLHDLWNIDISDYAIAAVDEMGAHEKNVFHRLNYNQIFGYFNAGVLLINLEYWRNNFITNKCFEYISNYKERIVAHDQDILNALLYNKCLHIHFKWNVEEAFYQYVTANKYKNNSEFINTLHNPSVIHFTWKPKPWEFECQHPLKKKYFKYLSKTQWNNFKPKFIFKIWLKKHTRNILIFFKIRRPKYFPIR